MRYYFSLLLTLIGWPALGQQLVPYQQDGGWGYATRQGRVVVPPQYNAAEPMRYGLGRVRAGKLYGYVDSTGQVVIPVRFVAVAYADDLASLSLLKQVRPNWPVSIPPHLVLVVEFVPAIPVSAAEKRARERSILPRDEFRMGLCWPDGRELLPVKYSHFRALSPAPAASGGAGSLASPVADYYAAGRVAGYASGQTRSPCTVSYFEDEPYYEEQVLHRSGRLLLNGRWLPPINWLSGELLETSIRTPRHRVPHVVLDTTGRQVVPSDKNGQGYNTVNFLDPAEQFLLAHAWQEPYTFSTGPGLVLLLRRDGSPVSKYTFTQVQLIDQNQAIAYTYVPGSVDTTATCATFGSSSYRCTVALPLAGLLDLRTGEWLLSPRYEAMRRAGEGFVVQQRRLEGTADRRGELLIKPIYQLNSLYSCYDSASQQPLPYWLVFADDGLQLLNKRGRSLLTLPDTLAPRGPYGSCSHHQMALREYGNGPVDAVVELRPHPLRPKAVLRWRHQPPKAPDD